MSLPTIYLFARSPVYPSSLELSAHKLHYFMFFFFFPPLLSLYPIVKPMRAKQNSKGNTWKADYTFFFRKVHVELNCCLGPIIMFMLCERECVGWGLVGGALYHTRGISYYV